MLQKNYTCILLVFIGVNLNSFSICFEVFHGVIKYRAQMYNLPFLLGYSLVNEGIKLQKLSQL